MIAVIDYGAGNLRSVANALAALGAPFFITSDPQGLERGSAILLPGVGHFGQMMQALDSARLTPALQRRLEAGTPYLGICLGLHALFEASEEAPGVRGLGLEPGAVRRFPSGLRVPHMGWSSVEPVAAGILARPAMYYFAHSYYVPEGVAGTAALARHGVPFTAVLARDNLAGSQFHPEKSGPAGLEFLRAWVESALVESPRSQIPGARSG